MELAQIKSASERRVAPELAAVSRKVLCVFPRYQNAFGTFHHSYPLLGVKAFMPPQGMLLIAAYLPEHWEIKFVDENVRLTKDSEYKWADVVLVSGMHIQRMEINEINRRAHTFNKVTALGGPSVSGCPEYYPEFDYLHLGELGDATDDLIACFARSVQRPETQQTLTTQERLPLRDFPTPAYKMAGMHHYFLANVQYSSGCPYKCEFCDIPELYGNNPRMKTPEQIITELDEIVASGAVGAVYFVDDNFVGNRKAAKELLPHLVEWQKRNKYPVEFACEATLNIVRSPDLLEMMREASFWTVFCGIETPETHALAAMKKSQNNEAPILESVQKLNSYGMEVVSGMIIGFDTDTYETADRIIEFVEASNIPVLTINLLEALPRTPLHRRLTAAGRINATPGRESNVEFLLPYDDVVAMWRRTFTAAFQPEAIYRRFEYNVKHTYPNRVEIPPTGKLSFKNVMLGVKTLGRLIWRVGVVGDYRKVFWKMGEACTEGSGYRDCNSCEPGIAPHDPVREGS